MKKFIPVLFGLGCLVVALISMFNRESENKQIASSPVQTSEVAKAEQAIDNAVMFVANEPAPVVQNSNGTYTVTDSGGTVDLIIPVRHQKTPFVPEAVNKARIEAAMKR